MIRGKCPVAHTCDGNDTVGSAKVSRMATLAGTLLRWLLTALTLNR